MALAGCSQGATTAEPPQPPQIETTPVTLLPFKALRQTSCAPDTNPISPRNITIKAEAIQLTDGPLTSDALPGMRFAGGWHFTSEEPNFGGLSGLDILPSGDLLSVSDQGAFVWIAMTDGAPDGHGQIGYMLDANGKALSGKRAGDSEGLHLVDGLALVSFERNHRISGFDLTGCGMAAREAGFASTSADGRSDNRGMEALTLQNDLLLAGWEAPARGRAELSVYDVSLAQQYETRRISAPKGLALTGMDVLDGQIYALYRGFSPLSGARIEIRRLNNNEPGKPTRLARLKRPLTVDNFEGIAATRLADGTVRLYIISDNNFSQRQRTLLMAFDVLPDPHAD